jgi:hypothetical protein
MAGVCETIRENHKFAQWAKIPIAGEIEQTSRMADLFLAHAQEIIRKATALAKMQEFKTVADMTASSRSLEKQHKAMLQSAGGEVSTREIADLYGYAGPAGVMKIIQELEKADRITTQTGRRSYKRGEPDYLAIISRIENPRHGRPGARKGQNNGS